MPRENIKQCFDSTLKLEEETTVKWFVNFSFIIVKTNRFLRTESSLYCLVSQKCSMYLIIRSQFSLGTNSYY